MSDQYVGEIRMFSGNYAPQGWHFCDGSVLSIAGNEVLYALIGTTYGGNGVTTFQLPDLRGRVPIHISSNYSLGQAGGAEQVMLTQSQLPAHTHAANANSGVSDSTSSLPEGHYWGYSSITNYQPANPNVTMNVAAVASAGGYQPHNNMMPSMATNFIIALQGVFPSQG